MKKIKKKSIKKKSYKKKSINKRFKRVIFKKKNLKNRIIKKKIKNYIYKTKKQESIASKMVKLQFYLKSKLDLKINFGLEKYVQAFFDKNADTISEYKILKEDEKNR